jgi:Galactose oxidase, central domain
MGRLARNLRTSAISFSLVVGAWLTILPAPARAQDKDSALKLRQFAAIAHNTVTHQFVLFGGVNNSESGGGSGPYLDDTWLWSGTAWEGQAPTRQPEGRFDAAMAYDSARHQAVLFGGNNQHSSRTASSPWATVRVYPASLHQEGADVFYRDTWIWDGTDWAQRNPAQAPPERAAHAMAFDGARKQVVLFGGFGRDGKLLNDTWVWDGSNWKKMNPANIPPARSWPAIAYDPDHQRIVMFGGQVDPDAASPRRHPIDDTWTWDGNNWTKMETTGDLPEPRFEAAMDYDSSQKRLLLISGYVQDSTGIGTTANDTWIWDGANWSQLPPEEFALIYDPSQFDPKETNRALVVSVCAPIIWVPRHAPKPQPRDENVEGNAATDPQ